MYENSRFLKNRFTFCGVNTNFGQQWAPPAYYHLTPIVSKGKHWYILHRNLYNLYNHVISDLFNKYRNIVYKRILPVCCDCKMTHEQVEAQRDCGPGSEIGASWIIGVTWSRKRSFKMAATELRYLLTKSPFWLSLWHDISISWHGGKEL